MTKERMAVRAGEGHGVAIGLLRRAGLYWHTARHLRWEQVVYRPLRQVQHRLPLRLPAGGEAAEERFPALAAAVAAWGPDDAAARLARAREVAAGRFTFLGRTKALEPVDWTRRHGSHLWSYHLQYFGYGVDLAWAWRLTGEARFARRFAALAEGWMHAARPGAGDAWQPYPVSVRIVSWTHALLLFGDALDGRFRRRLLESLHAQAAYLERRLERHVLANHLQRNLAALVTVGLLFRGAAPERWLRRGAARLWREVAEQVLPDGGHYERSPMYHAIAAGDLLEVMALMNAAGVRVPGAVRARVAAMVRALGVLARPDGTLHLFNDAAHDAAPSRGYLAALAARVVDARPEDPRGAFALPRAGFYGWADPERGERLVIDAGEPGPAYQPGHAHCGLLGFELDLAGAPFAVDAGLSGYAGDPLREYVRSTRAHNTVQIAGLEQSEVWGTFRMARRARLLDASHAEAEGGYRFEGAYRPYHDPAAAHRRTVTRDGAGWRIADRVEGAAGAPVASFLHLHPDWRVEAEGTAFVARRGEAAVRIEPFGGDAVRVAVGEREPAQGWYCPRLGTAVPAPVLVLAIERNDGRECGWTFRVLSPDP
ncbi:MAG TPA: alginate lyase family protein [Longimicrobium sp.]|nr:alginate lyase family protein [Longimicrobium sp.]